MSFVARGARNAFRNPIRTVSIVVILSLSVALAITMILARQAVSNKITSVKASIGNTITIQPAGSNGFEGGGEPLTSANVVTVAKLPHVKSYVATLSARLETTDTSLISSIAAGTLGQRNQSGAQPASGPTSTRTGVSSFGGGNFTPPVEVIGTTDPSTISGSAVALTSGGAIDGTSTANVAMIGSGLATTNNLKVGSTFTMYKKLIVVSGIFTTGTRFGGNEVIMPLATLQTLADEAGQISEITVTPDSISDGDALVSSIKSAVGSIADVTSEQDTATQALAPLASIQSVTLYSVIGAVVAGAVITFLTMLMIVRERRREIGVFKAIGASNAKIVIGFVTEAFVLTLLGAIVGVIVGSLVANSVTGVLVSSASSSSTTQSVATTARGMGGGFGRSFSGATRNVRGALTNIHTAIGYAVLLYGLAGAALIAILGSAIPAFLIAKVRPAEVMRGE